MPNYNIPIGGVVRAVDYCTVPGQVSTNTRKWQLVALSTGTGFSSSAFTLTYDSQLSGWMLVLLSTGAEYYGTQVYLMNPIGAAPRPDATNVNQGAGTFGAGLLPTQTSGLVQLYSTTLGKIGQGRTYVPFPSPTASEANGTPTAGYLNALNDLGGFLSSNLTVVDGVQVATFRPCLYRGGADVPRFLESFRRPDAWATQRRRGSFGRTNSLPF